VPASRRTEGDEVDEEDLVRQRHELEVGELHNGPDHPVLGQRIEVCALQLLLWVGALEDGHGAQETEQVGASKHSLVGEDARDDLEVGLARDDNLLLEETEPLHGCGTEDTATVEDHAASTREVVVLEALLLDQLLGHGIASREEDAGGDGLGKDRARGQLGLVPVGHIVSGVRIYWRDGRLTSAASWATCSCVVWMKVYLVQGWRVNGKQVQGLRPRPL
jgi:hypothetical protein